MSDHKRGFDLNDPSRLATDKAVQGEIPPLFPDETTSRTSGHRDGEIIIAIPEPEISQKRVLTEEEIKHYEAIDSKRERQRINALEEQLMLEGGNFLVPDWIRKVCMWGMVCVGTTLLLMVVGQVTSFLAQFHSMPIWSQWIVGMLLSLLVGIILYLIFKLSLLFCKLQKNEQINLTAIDALKKREALRHLVQRSSRDAVGQLKTYLKDFPVESKQKFLALGFSPNEFDELSEARNKLIKDREGENWQRWLEQYRAGFQSTLDNIANRRVKAYALKTALKTSISPLPILDSAIVLALSLSMVRDLMTLYNLKMNKIGAGKLLLHAIGQVYLAGHLQDLSVSVADFLSESLTAHFGQVTAKVGKFVGSKAGEGIANGVMIYRLGKATTKLLQPTC